jgi:RNA polymerase sigma-70 factor (ECF subfamily)
MSPPLDQRASSASDAGQSTSHTLLERVQRLDPEAWRRFAALYAPIVYRWAIRYGLQPHDASDVTQDTFQAVAQNIQRFQRRTASDSLRGWLWAITRNKIRDHFRQRQKQPAAIGGSEAHGQLQQTPNPPEHLEESADLVAAELSNRAMRLIQNEFEATTWQAFWATAVEGRYVADVATQLGLTQAAVYKAKSRVLLRLRQELDGLLD